MEPRNRNVVIVVVALVVLLCLCLAVAAVLVLSSFFISDARTLGPGTTMSAEESRTFAVEPGASLTVDNFAGSVTVRAGGEGQIQVRAVRRAATSASSNRIQVRFDEAAGGLQIRTMRPAGVLNARVDLEIQVPPGTPVEVETGAGNLEVRGVTGGLRAETGSGNVQAQGLAGGVDLGSGSGSVELQDVAGDVAVDTGSGNVTLRGIDGDLTAHTSSGSIRVEGATGQVRLDTGSGSVEYRGTPAGDCRFETGSGSIVLYLPADLDARVDLTTGSGSIDVQFPVEGETRRGRVQGVIGSGEEATIRAQPGSGSIDVFQD